MTNDEAIEYIKIFIKKKDSEKDYGWVESEVLDEYFKYMRNSPSEDGYDHVLSAIHATAHQ